MAQTGAPYARVPGIRVYGMICLKKPFRRRGGRNLSGFGGGEEAADQQESKRGGRAVRMRTQVPLPKNWESIAEHLATEEDEILVAK